MPPGPDLHFFYKKWSEPYTKCMWIEQRPLHFAPLQVKQKGKDYILQLGNTSVQLNAREYQYYDQLAHGLSIQQLVKDFIKKGWLVSFRDLYAVVDRLSQNNLIINPEVLAYFKAAKQGYTSSGLVEFSQHKGKIQANPEKLKGLPFFRTLHPDIQKLFIANAQITQAPAQTRLCKHGELSRELFVLLEGQAGVYQTFPDGRRQLLSVISEGSVFGEGGFLLGKPRGADVITMVPSLVASIQHLPQFTDLIDSGKAEALQRRFWVLNGLLTSELFSNVPAETIDSLVFAGKIQNVKENTIIIKEGTLGRSFFIIIQGSVAFTKGGKTLRAVGQGGIFGEIALMISSGTRAATAQAQRDCLLLEIGMEEFYDVMSNHLVLAKMIEEQAWQRWYTPTPGRAK